MEKTTEVESNISRARVLSIIAIFGIFLGGTALLAAIEHVLIDTMMCAGFFDILMVAVLVVQLVRLRKGGKLDDPADNYGWLCLFLLAGWILVILGVFLPAFFAPFPILVYLLFSHMDDLLAMTFCSYYLCIFGLLGGISKDSLYCYLFGIVLNALFASYIKENDARYLYLICSMVAAINTFLPFAFYYFSHNGTGIVILIKCILYSAVVTLFVIAVYPRLLEWSKSRREVTYEQLLKNDYPLLSDIREYSRAEFRHAQHVSYLAAKCARKIGAKEMTCAVGGMYYRIGILEGKPVVENAVKLATAHCFPPDVISILNEFEGRKVLPQSPESAIVHMVDALVTRMEVLDAETVSTEWNQDMVIYQTLNEYSSSGMYDEANLSMNQFLLVRETLVEEGI